MSVSEDDLTNALVGRFYSLLSVRAKDIMGEGFVDAPSSSSCSASAETLREELLAAIKACPLQSSAHYRIINNYTQDDDKRIVDENSNDINDKDSAFFLSHINALKMPQIDFLDDLLPRLQLKNTADLQLLQQSHMVNERKLQAAMASFDKQHNYAYNKLADRISYSCNAIDRIFTDFTKRLATEKAPFRRAREDVVEQVEELGYLRKSAACRDALRRANSCSDSRKDMFIRHIAEINERSLAAMQALFAYSASADNDATGGDGGDDTPIHSLRQQCNDAMSTRLETYCDRLLASVALSHKQLAQFDCQTSAVERTRWVALVRKQHESWLRETLAGIESIFCRTTESLLEQLLRLRAAHGNLLMYRHSLEAALNGAPGVHIRAGSRVRDLCSATETEPQELLRLLLQLKQLVEEES